MPGADDYNGTCPSNVPMIPIFSFINSFNQINGRRLTDQLKSQQIMQSADSQKMDQHFS